MSRTNELNFKAAVRGLDKAGTVEMHFFREGVNFSRFERWGEGEGEGGHALVCGGINEDFPPCTGYEQIPRCLAADFARF